MVRKILVVDESATMRRIICAMILSNINDAVVDEVANKDEALAWLGQRDCHLILCSLDVVDFLGFELFRELRQEGRDIPFVMLFGKQEKYLKMAKQHGLEEYLVMPCSAKVLTDTINRVCSPVSLRRWQRYSAPGTRAVIEQGPLLLAAEVVNISEGGVLCEFDSQPVLNLAAPVMMAVTFVMEGREFVAAGLYSLMGNIKVVERYSDLTPKRYRAGFVFVAAAEAQPIFEKVFSALEMQAAMPASI